MKRMKKKRELLENMIRLEERDMEVVKSENKQAQQAVAEMERQVELARTSISELESLIRTGLSGKFPLSIEDLQGQRRYLAVQRLQLDSHLEHKSKADALAERISSQLMKKQSKLNKLRELIDNVDKHVWQSNEKRILKEHDEIWVRSQGGGR